MGKDDEVIKEMKRMFENLEASVQKSKEELKEEINKVNEIVFRLVESDERNREEIQSLKRRIEDLEEKNEQLEQYSRKDNIIISGVPRKNGKEETEKELISILTNLAEKLDTDIEPFDIKAIHGIHTRKNTENEAPIIVRLNNRMKKAKLVRKSKEKRLDGIYISNHLSQQTQQIFAKARELKRRNVVKFA